MVLGRFFTLYSCSRCRSNYLWWAHQLHGTFHVQSETWLFSWASVQHLPFHGLWCLSGRIWYPMFFNPVQPSSIVSEAILIRNPPDQNIATPLVYNCSLSLGLFSKGVSGLDHSNYWCLPEIRDLLVRKYDGNCIVNIKKTIVYVKRNTTILHVTLFCKLPCRPCTSTMWNDQSLNLL